MTSRLLICPVCGQQGLYSRTLGVCAECIRSSAEMPRTAKELRVRLREKFSLPSGIPATEGGVTCVACGNHCRLGETEMGFCGTKQNQNTALLTILGSPEAGCLDWYHDALPTNCVAAWVCPERAGHAVPGTVNLAVFYRSCTFDCLSCQNWHFRESAPTRSLMSSHELFRQGLSGNVQCVCFFGGDPGSQIEHALSTGQEILLAAPVSPPRICWETNGNMAASSLKRAVALSRQTGGIIKFDLKTDSERLHRVLTGASSRPTRANFRRLVKWASNWSHDTPVVASSLLMPGYVDTQEIAGIARFIADISVDIPYSLLGFAPQYAMSDLPPTSIGHAERCLEAARAEGLKRVHVGNRHLLQAGDY